MSKIYEALLRAEIDRLTSAKNGHHPGASAPSGIALAEEKDSFASARFPDVAEAVPKDAEWKAQPQPVSVATPSPLPEEFPEAPTIRWADVSRVPWSPDLNRLPSLQQRGGAVEQIRGLRSRMHEFRHLNAIKTLLISSGLPEEGKSFVTANLAISFANYKSSRVLLIDGDMRRGTLHKLLGTHNEPGLSEFLSGKARLTDIVQQAKPSEAGAKLPSGLNSLFFIPCGADADNAADLSGNGRFEQLLKAVEPAFDWIVVDSSPVNLVADGANLGRACDGVLLVTRGAVTKFETAQRALNELKASKVLGVVLNAVKDVPAVGGYYGYDG